MESRYRVLKGPFRGIKSPVPSGKIDSFYDTGFFFLQYVSVGNAGVTALKRDGSVSYGVWRKCEDYSFDVWMDLLAFNWRGGRLLAVSLQDA